MADSRPGRLRGLVSAPLSPLVGRAYELGLASDLLRRRRVRLLTLRGPGGIGKTRLAQELARELSPEYEQGGLFVELAGLRDPAHVLPAVLAALQVPLGSSDPIDVIARNLGPGRLLLLLDNLEHLLDAGPDLTRLLGQVSDLDLVTTSRRALHVTGEHELPVGPLAWGETPDAGMPAMQLFVERASARDPEFRLHPGNMADIHRICGKLQGVPLSLELAAARLHALSARTLLEWLDQPLEALADGARDLPERLQSLRSTLEWSYDLLDPGDRELLLCCSVFLGSFTLEALQEVAGLASVRSGVTSLVEQSFLRRTHERYSLLESVRGLTQEKLSGTQTLGHWQERHAAYYTALACRMDRRAASTGWFLPQEAWEQFVENHPELLAALAHWVGSGQQLRALQLGTALYRYWYSHGSSREGVQWLTRVIGMPGTDDHPVLLAQAYNALGNFLLEQGQLARAEELQRSALAVLDSARDESLRSEVQIDLAFTLLAKGRLSEAEPIFLAVARDHEACGQALFAGVARNGLARIMVVTGRYEDALSAVDRAIEHHRASGNQRGLAISHGWKSQAYRALGQPQRAWQDMLMCLEVCLQAHMEGLLAHAMPMVVVEWLMDDGQHGLAVRYLAAGVAWRERKGVTLQPAQQAELDGLCRTLTGILGADAFHDAWAQGLTSTDALLEALHRDLRQRKVHDPPPGGQDALRALTARERDVAVLVTAGLSDKRIAQKLGISVWTVNKHVASMLAKLALNNRVALTRWALEHGIADQSG
ncbi:ATP-binding protein [Deinococcus navajonensis]|uniref:ATP-binding protein n=1 Tax=Deinococcus navajonensis TaxID=309884 RepID=A0ABV8XQY4_9DEIO